MTIAIHQPALPVPSRTGQATAIEQSRAIAEVQAAVVVAQQMPRNIDRANSEMLRSCNRKALAERAFYRYPRGGQQVTGETVVLAKELARCWGNIQYGIAELSRNDAAGESEMQAFAWDLETNARPSTTFIVPHLRDTSDGPRRLTDARDVYENNANMGARRQREMIFNVLPPWFIEDAKAACYATLNRDDSDGETLAERAATAVGRFGKIGVKPAQLVQKIGAPQDKWSAADLAQLGVIYRSIERGETSKDEEFGAAPGHVTAAEIVAEKPAKRRRRAPKDASLAEEAPPGPPAEPAGEAPGERPPAMATGGQIGFIESNFERLGYNLDDPSEKKAQLRRTALLARRGDITHTGQLTQEEAAQVKEALDGCDDVTDLERLLEDGEVAGDE